jgi:peroxiredoxin
MFKARHGRCVFWGALILLVFGCATVGTTPTKLPSETLQKSDDERFELSSLKGHVVLLDFWATWCKPCRFALPAYAMLHEKHSEKGLKVVAVSVDHDVVALRRYLRKNPVPFPVLSDSEGRFAQVMGVSMMPSTFLVDRRGNIRAFYPGFNPTMLQELTAQLESILAEVE